MRRSTMWCSTATATGVATALLLMAGGPVRAATRRAIHASRARGGAVALHPVELPDGSGTLQLPAGWRITAANKGMVDAVGPQGAVDLGIWTPVFTPQAASQMYVRPPLVIPYGDPAVAARQMTAVLNATPGHTGSFRWLRLIEKKPTPWPNGVGEFIHYEWLYNGVRCQSVALILESPNVDGTFTY